MEEMAKIEAKGDASQEKLEALAADLSSKVAVIAHVFSRIINTILVHSSFC